LDLAKGTHALIYQKSIEGINQILTECWNVYTADNNNKNINYFHKMAALKLARECNESIYNLTHEGPTVMAVREIGEKARRLGIDSDNNNNYAGYYYQQPSPMDTDTDVDIDNFRKDRS
jgi:hypothetical protein